MSEFKGTKGEWYVERTSSEDGDFQGRILCKSSEKKSLHKDEPQIYIIAGGPSKRNGVANIHCEANAKLIAAAPELLKSLCGLISPGAGGPLRCLKDEGFEDEVKEAQRVIEKALK